MPEERTLLAIVHQEGMGVMLRVNCDGYEDLMTVCVLLRQLLYENPKFEAGFVAVNQMYEDEEFQEKLKEQCIQVPDFNSLLKNPNKEKQ